MTECVAVREHSSHDPALHSCDVAQLQPAVGPFLPVPGPAPSHGHPNLVFSWLPFPKASEAAGKVAGCWGLGQSFTVGEKETPTSSPFA